MVGARVEGVLTRLPPASARWLTAVHLMKRCSQTRSASMFKGMGPIRNLINIFVVMYCFSSLAQSSSLLPDRGHELHLHPGNLHRESGDTATSFQKQHRGHESAANAHPSQIPSHGITHHDSSAPLPPSTTRVIEQPALRHADLELTQSPSDAIFEKLLDRRMRSDPLAQQVRELEDRMMKRIESMESKLYQSMLLSSSKLEKMMDEQTFYCSQSLINVMSLVESKVSQNIDQVSKAKDFLEQKMERLSSMLSSRDQAVASRLDAHEAAVERRFSLFASESDVKYQSLVNNVRDMTLTVKSMNESLDQLSKVETNEGRMMKSADRSRSLSNVVLTSASVDEHLKKIDMDVETYSKKVVNNMSDLWRISKSIEVITNSSTRLMNQTFTSMTHQLAAMNQSLSHDMPSVLSIVHRSMESRFNELADKVLESHNVILMNQNHFRDSCQRIQREEGQVYDEFDARLDIMNSTMFSMIDIESRMSERMDKKLHDIFSLMEKTVRFVKHRFREFPDTDPALNRFNLTAVSSEPAHPSNTPPVRVASLAKQQAPRTSE